MATQIGRGGAMSKHKAHLGKVKSGYYDQQYNVTARNKALRKARAARRKSRWSNTEKEVLNVSA